MIYSIETTFIPEWDIRLYRINCENIVTNKDGKPESYYCSVMAGWHYGGEIMPGFIKCNVLDVIRNTYPDYNIDIVEENGKLLWKTSAGNCDELYL